MSRRSKIWTEAELAELERRWRDGEHANDLAIRFGACRDTIFKRAQSLPKRKRNELKGGIWTPSRLVQLQALIEDGRSFEECVQAMPGLSVSSMQKHYYSIRIRLGHAPPLARWSKAQLAELTRRWENGESGRRIARAIGRTHWAIVRKASDLGLTKRRGNHRRFPQDAIIFDALKKRGPLSAQQLQQYVGGNQKKTSRTIQRLLARNKLIRDQPVAGRGRHLTYRLADDADAQ